MILVLAAAKMPLNTEWETEFCFMCINWWVKGWMEAKWPFWSPQPWEIYEFREIKRWLTVKRLFGRCKRHLEGRTFPPNGATAVEDSVSTTWPREEEFPLGKMLSPKCTVFVPTCSLGRRNVNRQWLYAVHTLHQQRSRLYPHIQR